MLNYSSQSLEGPYGYTRFGDVSWAQMGDVVAFSDISSPTFGQLNHAMVVTKVNGDYGNRIPSDLFVAAHNSSTNSVYQPLLDYAGNYPVSHFTLCKILSGYYSTPQ